ncbi:MAG: pyridoxal phosphate-dependent aminotransferase [Bacteroidales bacterium]
MKNTPINSDKVTARIRDSNISSPGKANIRDIVRLVNQIEEATGEKFIRMEMGVPGLSPHKVGIDAEIEALKRGVASDYPMIEGVAELKQEASRFISMFMNIDIKPECCIPTVGSLQASMAAFMTVGRAVSKKDTVLLLDPGFPVHKQQLRVLGLNYDCFDVYRYRGDKLRDKLEHHLSGGNICCILYSNPNNPSWICFSEKELQIISELADKYDVIILEDLAYFGMDFRKDLSVPGQPPYQVTVANYTSNYILLISSSKVFSYAGQRTGILSVSDELFNRRYPDLKRFYSSDRLGYAIVYGSLYSLSAGTNHSSQYGLAAMLKAASDGKYKFVEHVREYGMRAGIMKKMFLENGFRIVYDMDEDLPVGDGFYFTIAYPGFTGGELLERLLYYGISAISLEITGSMQKDGLRACVSQISRNQFTVLEKRLKCFHRDHPVN